MADKNDRRLPESGQWPDKLLIPSIIASGLLCITGFLMAFLWVAPVNGAEADGFELVGDVVVTHVQLLSQKIFYFHMPAAIISFGALAFSAYYGIRFLVSRKQRFDTCSRTAMEVALLFVILTMVTGDLWTRFEWGVWWTWEPRLTTYLILMLIAIAYFVLRGAVDDPERRAVFSAVVSIIALVDVPICFMVTRIIPSSVHPVITREGGMTPEMAMTVIVVLAGMTLLAFVLYRVRFRQHRLNERISALKDKLE